MLVSNTYASKSIAPRFLLPKNSLPPITLLRLIISKFITPDRLIDLLKVWWLFHCIGRGGLNLTHLLRTSTSCFPPIYVVWYPRLDFLNIIGMLPKYLIYFFHTNHKLFYQSSRELSRGIGNQLIAAAYVNCHSGLCWLIFNL